MKTWWIDPIPVDEEAEGCLDAYSFEPQQGPLNWRARLIRVVPESELTKLRKRVDVLSEALKSIESGQVYHDGKKGVTPKTRARVALSESAKIAGE